MPQKNIRERKEGKRNEERRIHSPWHQRNSIGEAQLLQLIRMLLCIFLVGLLQVLNLFLQLRAVST